MAPVRLRCGASIVRRICVQGVRMTRKQSAVGLAILAAGIVILLGKLGVFAFIGSVFWPLFVLVPGILLHVLFFGRMLPNAAALVPAGLLTVYGLLFFFCNLAGWGTLAYLWPVFLLGPAVGLYEYSLFGTDRSGRLQTAALALAALAGLLLLLSLLWTWGVYIIAIGLIAAGAWLAYGRRIRW